MENLTFFDDLYYGNPIDLEEVPTSIKGYISLFERKIQSQKAVDSSKITKFQSAIEIAVNDPSLVLEPQIKQSLIHTIYFYSIINGIGIDTIPNLELFSSIVNIAWGNVLKIVKHMPDMSNIQKLSQNIFTSINLVVTSAEEQKIKKLI